MNKRQLERKVERKLKALEKKLPETFYIVILDAFAYHAYINTMVPFFKTASNMLKETTFWKVTKRGNQLEFEKWKSEKK